ncbi:uncharacterized protein [Macrobrachium rosenbergii]|uniref:uncharacterized protein n=1 Tax=Macrobrachium rosenbergii TaxID=79674 RepID=UPI0034D3A99E
MVTKKQLQILKKLYGNVKYPSSFSGVNTLARDVRQVEKNITRDDVKDFLQSQPSYTLHKGTLKKFPRRKVLSPKPRVIVSSDLADMSKLAPYNGGYKYLLIVIDQFSRYLQVVPLKKKDGNTMQRSLKKVFESEAFSGVSRLNTDEGREFYNKQVKEYLNSRNIKLYSVHSREIKTAIAERVIRTLKSKIYRYLTHNNTNKYVDILQDIVNSYNSTQHRGLGDGQTPNHVHALVDREDINRQFSRMYINGLPRKEPSSSLLKVSNVVRIADENRCALFRKGYTVQNTYELFTVREVDKKQYPTVYYLEDLQGELIKGMFYREKLIPAKLPELYDIVILKKRKRGNRTQYFVEWRGYPKHFNSWLDESQLVRV